MSEDAYGTVAVDYATVEKARKLVGGSPWACRWRARPDGAVELIRRQDSRAVLFLIRGEGAAERIAESVPQSKASKRLQLGGYAAFPGFFLAFVSPGFLIVLVLGIVAWAIGRKLDESPKVDEWAEQHRGAGAPWVVVPRVVGAPMPTGGQLIVASGIADAHNERALYRDRGDGVVEVATKRRRRVELRTLDRFGREIDVRDLPVKRLSARRLRRALGEPSAWHYLRTNEPVDD
jgi:hypothetical protein